MHVQKNAATATIGCSQQVSDLYIQFSEAAKRGNFYHCEKIMEKINIENNNILLTQERLLKGSQKLILELKSGTNIELIKESIHVETFLDSLKSCLTSTLNSKGNRLEIEINNINSSIELDPERVYFILENLILNSHKFTEHGLIKMIVKNIAPEESLYCHLQIEVIDNGCGVNEEDIPHLFQIYYTNSTSSQSNSQGSGVGLYVCLQNAKAMDGNIIIKRASPEGGTVSTVHIMTNFSNSQELCIDNLNCDLVESKPPAVCPFEMPNNLPISTLKICIAEDEALNQKIMHRIITKIIENLHKPYPIEFLIVSNGKEALNVYKTSPNIIVIFTDINMPEMNGITLTKKIRKLERKEINRRKIPIFVISANTEPEDRQIYESAGVNGILTKPYQSEAIKSCISGVLASYESSLSLCATN